jgi:DNA-binding NarL/FixJ family response regulator
MREVRIMIADDHAIVRRGLRSLLENQPGWEVSAEASNGREAVEKAAQFKPDVAVVDIGMPQLNGLDATRQIVAVVPATEVLILTMHQSEEVAREVLRAGARGYVLKSDADVHLIAAVDALLHHKPFLTSAVTDVFFGDYMNSWAASEEPQGDRRVTAREREIIQLLAEGKSNKEVAAALGISVRTAEAHRANINNKLGFTSLTDLVRYAIRNRITIS